MDSNLSPCGTERARADLLAHSSTIIPSNRMAPTLPVETLVHVVDALASLPNPLQYGRTLEVQTALLQLCLTSKTLYAIARVHLYSSVVIRSASGLALFHRTICSPSSTPPEVVSIAFLASPSGMNLSHEARMATAGSDGLLLYAGWAGPQGTFTMTPVSNAPGSTMLIYRVIE